MMVLPFVPKYFCRNIMPRIRFWQTIDTFLEHFSKITGKVPELLFKTFNFAWFNYDIGVVYFHLKILADDNKASDYLVHKV